MYLFTFVCLPKLVSSCIENVEMRFFKCLILQILLMQQLILLVKLVGSMVQQVATITNPDNKAT